VEKKRINNTIVIFNETSALFFGEGKTPEPGFRTVAVGGRKEMNDFVRHFLEEQKTGDILLKGLPEKQLFKLFKKNFKFVKAAGGLVRNENGQYLFIKRFGIPDLPKGKLKKGEGPEQGAIREVEEETGVKDLKIVKKLAPTFHVYERNGKTILKKTFWYLMTTLSKQDLIPQTEEDITEAMWLDSDNSLEALKKSYRSLNCFLSPYIV